MTPEEVAVINAALATHGEIRARDDILGVNHDPQQRALLKAIEALIFNCPECNTDRHTCPGCGASVPHAGRGVCAECIETHGMSEDEHPPVGESNQASSAFAELIGAELGTCLCPRNRRVYCHRSDCHGGADVTDEPAWVLRTVRDVREGDVVRMPGAPDSERVAENVSPVLNWHVHPAADPYHPERMPADWSSVRIWGIAFDPAMPIEIKLSPSETAAIEIIGWAQRISTK